MGDRICLTFVDNRGDKSPTLYCHWDGMDIIDSARAFAREYEGKIRTEPANWMFNFVAYLSRGEVKDGNYYLYPTAKDSCSPDDNGYWEFNTETKAFWKV